MKQICSIISVLEVFFQEPTKIQFIREIGRKINLAQTSTRNNIRELEKQGLIIKKKSSPFDGFIANRENEKFTYYKQVYNIYSLYEIKKKIVEEISPKAIILFGSYLRGEDIETSDVDIIILSKIKKELDFSKFEKSLKRNIHLIFVKEFSELDDNIKKSINNGLVMHGEK